MKKIYTILMLFLSVFVLNGCQPNHNFDYTPPLLYEYQLDELEFCDYTPSTITDYDNINDDLILNSLQGNIYITNISYNNEWPFSEKDNYSGSGVIFYETKNYYYALTNSHIVVKHRDFLKNIIEVFDYFDNKYNAFIYEGSINYELDLAIIVFTKKEVVLPIAEIVDGNIETGQNVIAIGNPMGERNTISIGIVSRYNKTRITNRYGDITTKEFCSIIHTAKINFGCSGGMLLNYDLKVVGINYAGNNDEDNPNGFSIPSSIVVEYLKSFI